MEEYGRACERWVGGWREEGGGRRRECWRVKICGREMEDELGI